MPVGTAGTLPLIPGNQAWWQRFEQRWLHRLQWLAIAALLLPMAAYAALRLDADLLGDVRVRGLPIERGEAGVATLHDYANRWSKEQLAIHAGPYVANYARDQLGACLPTQRLSARLRSLGQTGLPSADLASLWASYTGGIDLAFTPSIDQTMLVARLSELRGRLERAPVPGMIMANGQALPGIPGVTLDLMQAIDQVEHALRNDMLEVALPIRNVPPPVPLVFGNDAAGRFGMVMMTYQTSYRSAGAAAGRAHNIETAVARLDGTVIEPGGDLSFNGIVGERSYRLGFASAKEIADKRIVNGVGGGVCQVAATLHAAAFLAGFDMPEYNPHSRPARYIPLGLDTMVAWPSQDLRIANPYPFAVRVRAQAQDGVLRMSLEGSGKPYLVEWNTQILQRIKPGTQELLDKTLAAGVSEQIQEPIDGLNVRRVRTIYRPTGAQREESMLRYPPNDRIIAIGSRSSRTLDQLASTRTRNASRLDTEDF
jgi:vancomycin resistance protein YoaR